MIEGIIVFALGFICGMYKDKIVNFIKTKFNFSEKEIMINE